MRSPRFGQLCCEEPFRVFFPLGLALGVVGVLLWPLFFLGGIQMYPGIVHARLMVEGFMSCFIFGFLGTAGPRVLSVPHFSAGEIVRLAIAVLAAAALHLRGNYALGDGLFLIALVLFATALVPRFRQRQDSPPPNFALVGLGLLNGIVGTSVLAICEATGSAPNLNRFATSLLDTGFVLLPLLGVAPFFLRRLLDLPTAEISRQNRTRQAALAIFSGLAIDASFALEIFAPSPAIGWVRFAIAAIYLGIVLPMRGNNTLAVGLRLSLASIVAGLALWALLPAYRVSALHIVFIGGFSVAILSVATRVILGHSGNLGLVRRRRVLFIVALVLVILAMVSRFVADFVPTRNEHLLWGAVCWLVAVAIWALVVLPHVTRTEEEIDAPVADGELPM